MESGDKIKRATVVPFDSLFGVAYTIARRRGVVLVGTKVEAEAVAASAIGEGQDFLDQLRRQSVSRARAEFL